MKLNPPNFQCQSKEFAHVLQRDRQPLHPSQVQTLGQNEEVEALLGSNRMPRTKGSI